MLDPFEELTKELRSRKIIETVLLLSPDAARLMLNEMQINGCFKRNNFYLNGSSAPSKIEFYLQRIASFKDESLKEFKFKMPNNHKTYYAFCDFDYPVIINTSMTGTKAVVATAPKT